MTEPNERPNYGKMFNFFARMGERVLRHTEITTLLLVSIGFCFGYLLAHYRAKNESVKPAPAKVEPAKVEPVKTESTKLGTSITESDKKFSVVEIFYFKDDDPYYPSMVQIWFSDVSGTSPNFNKIGFIQRFPQGGNYDCTKPTNYESCKKVMEEFSYFLKDLELAQPSQ